jgi:DNA polymerase-3 subunit epsilon
MTDEEDQKARALARKTKVSNICKWLMFMNPVVMDTETTGFKCDSEVVEVSIIDGRSESVIFSELIKPRVPITDEVAKINNITNEMLEPCPSMPAKWHSIKDLLDGKCIVAYNATFDQRLLGQSADVWGIDTSISFLAWFDLMQLYAEFHGAWNGKRQCWQSIKLAVAAEQMGIKADSAYHRALADTIVTRRLMIALANWKPEQDRG